MVTYAGDAAGSESTIVSAGTVQEIAAGDLAATLGGLSAGNAVQGTSVSVTAVTDNGTNVLSGATYSWQVSTNGTDWTTVGTGVSYTPTEADEGKALRLVVTYAGDAAGSESTIVSAGTVQEIVPTVSVPGNQTVSEDAGLVFNSANHNAITVADIDVGSSVTLSVLNGTLTLGSSSGLTFTKGDGITDTSMTFSGSLSSINAALAGLTYSPAQNFNGSDTLTLGTIDEAVAAISTIGIAVSAVNDQPVIVAPVELDYWTNSSSGNVTPINHISFGDADAGANPVTVTLSVGTGGALNSSSSGGVSVSGQGTNILTLVGSISDINAFLDGNHVLFDPPGSSLANQTLTVAINDGGFSGAGGPQSATTNVTLHSTSFTFTNLADTADLHAIDMNGISNVSMSGGNDTLTTSWNHTGTTTYNGGSGTDTVTLVFSPGQLEQILSSTSGENGLESRLQNYLDGSPSGASLDLSSSGWNAKVQSFESASVALGVGSVTVATAIGNTLPTYISGTTGNGNTIVGTSGNDTLTAQSGNNILVGVAGNDTLNAGPGFDLLLGGAGNDTLRAGIGVTAHDIMWGGAGNDTFVFNPGTNANTVLDFQHGLDQIEFDNVSFSSFAELQSLMHASGADTVINFSATDSVTLTQVNPQILTAADFIIHHA